MKKPSITILILLFSMTIVLAQEMSLKEQALKEFKNEHYNEAIGLLEKALVKSPDDAEIYYYLGWFNHYKAYDSRPLKGYDNSYSDQIFEYLDKALELNPNYGDAKYFYGAQCSGNAFLAMQNYDADKIKYFYQRAFKKGAYPEWLKEFGKNFLMSCDTNAILFTGGNADFDICSYLQLCENFRTDITLISLGYLDRPWYVKFLKNGLNNVIEKVEINLTEQQVMDIHPFKWDTTTVSIQVSAIDKKQYSLSDNYQLQWEVLPDLFSERMHSKIKGEKAKARTYISPQRAILLQIVEDNLHKRPICFSNFASPVFYGGLDNYFQHYGLVSKLLPINTDDSNYAVDESKLEALIIPENLGNYKTIKGNNIPRISGIVMYGYSNAFLYLANVYKESGEKNKLKSLIKIYEDKMNVNFNSEYETKVVKELKK
nr:hypothetical protein [uncultured Draconibacterium sp.]